MASSSWSLDLPDGRHQIEVDYGYWSGRATVRVDGHVASESNQLLGMAFNRGVDLPFAIDRHHVIVSIRPILRASVIATGYAFGLSVDATPAPGIEPVAHIQGANLGPRFIELMAWATAGGGVIGLSQHGEHPTAFLFLAAPVACSVVARRTTFRTRTMALLCLGIIIVGVIAVAAIGAIVQR